MALPLKEILGSIPGLVGIRLEEEPEYTVERKEGAFEIRHYPPMLLAQTTVEGTRDQAVDEGFHRLADYIFGGNQSKRRFSMTSPVLQSETLPMTTPVFQEQNEDGRSTLQQSWTISFVLPHDITELSAPTPLDQSVRITTQPEKTVASFRYSGNNTTSKMKEAEEKLKSWVTKQDLRSVSHVTWAQYDQPFAVPFLKRNEAQIEVIASRMMA